MFPKELGNARKGERKHFSLVYFFVWFRNSCLETAEWCGVTKNIKILINFCSQNTSLFGVKLTN